MSTNFLSLPGELSNKIYNHLLVREEPIDPWGDHGLELNLCLANKTIHRETESVLYGQNSFDLSSSNSRLLVGFLNRIGRDKAKHVRCLRINFPNIRYTEDDVSLEDDSVLILKKIQSECSDLKTLITSLPGLILLSLDALNNPRIIAKALELVDARFKAISSLQEVIAEVYGENITADTRMKMESFGWIVNVTEPEEEGDWDYGRDFSDLVDDIYFDGYDAEDDYDVDNDSDFDRRALD